MSTIAIDNFKPSAGGTSFGIEGIAKAWANIDGTGTIATRQDYNVSSITDLATGEIDVNYTNSMSAANYAAEGMAGNGGGLRSISPNDTGGSSFGASALGIYTGPDSGSAADLKYSTISVFGDLA